jgi:hypothetical protein
VPPLPKLKSSGRRFDQPPPTVLYFTVTSSGSTAKRDALEPIDGVRTTIVGAGDEAEAREIAELIEAQHAAHYGDTAWKIKSVEPNTEHDVG